MLIKFLALCFVISREIFALQSKAKKLELIKEEQVDRNHSLDSLSFLILVSLLIAHVITVWVFSRKRIWFMHPTGLALVYGRFSFHSYSHIIMASRAEYTFIATIFSDRKDQPS